MHSRGVDRPASFIGNHPSMEEVYRLIARFGPTRAPVLLLGETGTGKELVARALHAQSAAAEGPFEAINCAAIARGLAESEFFGHLRGAFTGADRDHAGAFERADGGTLFLDEVGELSLPLQPKLLRVLEERTVRPVGAQRSLRVNVRVIAATHRDLESETVKRRFRLDLFHRLAVGVITLPALRERQSDIPELAQHFLAQFNRENGQNLVLEHGVSDYLMRQSWPGNVRALRNAIERAATGARDMLRIRDFLAPSIARAQTAREGHVRYADRPFADTRREIYERTLYKHRGNRTAAAAELRIPKSTFFDQLRAMKLG